MNKVFWYNPKGEPAYGLYWVIWSAVLTIGAFYARYSGYVVAIKRLSLGANSFLIFWILLGLCFLWALREYIGAGKRKKIIDGLSVDQKSITMKDNEFTFPIIKKWACQMITIPYDAVDELRSKSDEDDGDSQIIYVNKKYKENRFEWFRENFPVDTDYDEFETVLIEKCTMITNR